MHFCDAGGAYSCIVASAIVAATCLRRTAIRQAVLAADHRYAKLFGKSQTLKTVPRLVSSPSMRENICGWVEEVSGRPSIAGKRSSCSSKEKTRPLPKTRRQERISSACGLPGLAVMPTGPESASSRCPPRIVSGLAGEHKLNLLCSLSWAVTANGSLVLCPIGTKAERPRHAPTDEKRICTRAPPQRVGRAFALLTKTYHGSRLTGEVGLGLLFENDESCG
jgi:hypothetical protein